MKKKIVWLLIVSLIAALLTSCSKTGGNPNGSPTVEQVIEGQIAAQESSQASEPAAESAASEEQSVVTIEAPTIILEKEEVTTEVKGAEGVDVDLTVLKGNMVYAQVFQMMYSSEDFIGKVVRIRGNLYHFKDEGTGREYYSCLIKDAAACCAQGIQFELTSDYSNPEDYYEIGEMFTVQGIFDSYVEGTVLYCTLRDAILIDE